MPPLSPLLSFPPSLPPQFPSMCERMRFRIKDKDKVGNDDFIGTTFINMSQISVGGEEGFLPTFGPCFVNIYGSPREFTDFPDKNDYLNMGVVSGVWPGGVVGGMSSVCDVAVCVCQIDGVAYRGRVMVEVDMTLGELPAHKQEAIKEADKKSILVSQC